MVVDAAGRRGDPVGVFAGLFHLHHQRTDVCLFLGARQPFVVALVPFCLGDHLALGRHPQVRVVGDGEGADLPVEGAVRQLQFEIHAVALQDLVPPAHAAVAVGDVVVAQTLVDRSQRVLLLDDELVALHLGQWVGGVAQHMVVVDLGLLEPALEPVGVEVGRVRGNLAAI